MYLVLLLQFVLIFISLLGFGITLFKVLKIIIDDLFGHFLFGSFFVTIISYFLNFYIPINEAVKIPVLSIGILLSIYFFIFEEQYLKYEISLKQFLTSIAILFIVSLWTFGPITHYDTGLYHMQMSKWIENYPLPKGLGNLHGRFAFNSFWTIFATVTKPLFINIEKPYYFANGLLIFGFLSHIILVLQKNELLLSDIFFLFTFPLIAFLGHSIPSGLSNDLPLSLIGVYIIHLYIRILEIDSVACLNDIFKVTTILSTFLFLIKLSSIVIFIVPIFIYLYSLKGKDKIPFNTLLGCMLLVAICFGIYVIRGIWLSGYPFYPSTSFSVDVAWKVPLQKVIEEYNAVKGWARYPSGGYEKYLDNYQWIGTWFKFYKREFIYITISLIISSLVFIIAWIKFKINVKNYFSIFVIFGVGIIFWFFTAPAPRFANLYLYGISFFLLAKAIFEFVKHQKFNFNKFRKFFYVVFSLLVFIYSFRSIKFLLDNGFDAHITYFPQKNIQLIINKSKNGVEVYTPYGDDRAWNAPLPSSPYLHENLLIENERNRIIFRIEK